MHGPADKKFPAFYGIRRFIGSLQEITTGPYREPVEVTNHFLTFILYITPRYRVLISRVATVLILIVFYRTLIIGLYSFVGLDISQVCRFHEILHISSRETFLRA
jgi:hypothetical protein